MSVGEPGWATLGQDLEWFYCWICWQFWEPMPVAHQIGNLTGQLLLTKFPQSFAADLLAFQLHCPVSLLLTKFPSPQTITSASAAHMSQSQSHMSHSRLICSRHQNMIRPACSPPLHLLAALYSVTFVSCNRERVKKRTFNGQVDRKIMWNEFLTTKNYHDFWTGW